MAKLDQAILQYQRKPNAKDFNTLLSILSENFKESDYVDLKKRLNGVDFSKLGNPEKSAINGVDNETLKALLKDKILEDELIAEAAAIVKARPKSQAAKDIQEVIYSLVKKGETATLVEAAIHVYEDYTGDKEAYKQEILKLLSSDLQKAFMQELKNVSEIPMNMRFKVSDSEWLIAEKFFKNNPNASKLDKTHTTGKKLSCYFVKIDGKIYAVKPGKHFAAGGAGNIKSAQDRKGNYVVIKIESIANVDEFSRKSNSAEWNRATQYFNQNPKEKLLPRDPNFKIYHNFIKSNNQIYAVLDDQKHGKYKICTDGNGKYFGIKEYHARKMIKGDYKLIDIEKLSIIKKPDTVETKVMKKRSSIVGTTRVYYPALKSFQPGRQKKDFTEGPSLDQTLGKQFTVQPMYTGGSLEGKIKDISKSNTSQDKATLFMPFLLEAGLRIKELHKKHIIHADIKDQNFMLDKAGHVREIDYGLSKRMRHHYTVKGEKGAGSPGYMSPEILNEGIYSYKSDVYAFGHMIERSFEELGLDLKQYPEVEELIGKMKDPEPQKRPTMKQAVRELDQIKNSLNASHKPMSYQQSIVSNLKNLFQFGAKRNAHPGGKPPPTPARSHMPKHGGFRGK